MKGFLDSRLRKGTLSLLYQRDELIVINEIGVSYPMNSSSGVGGS